ncbi:CDP-diacylglycerol--serine O-phosphatidyltransferase [Desulfohalovibrio reitneri]|uniref:CDP-diacylglycerol--serine O-phosphatidyltransferase n=1 Tax=Desulfohalovibrio reitneri TaxID=1307759 RepID=UPI000555C309|nr:CDP-diacylglycerol--serine O-phosphatidyltransferase [Desulfohalovibrio reitneri]
MEDKFIAKPRGKGVYILPNLMTTASLFAGFLGLTLAVDGRFGLAAVAVFVSFVLDGLDGKIARLTKTTSEFGVQLDSLADLVAFGVSPSLLLYLWKLQEYGRLGLAAAFLFTACAALRLARFNIQTKTSGKLLFTGLPTPAAGCTVAALVLFEQNLPGEAGAVLGPVGLVLAYGLSFLMVSRVRYFSFKEYGWLRAHALSALVAAVLLFVVVASQPTLLLFPLLGAYVLSGPIYTFLVLPRRRPGLFGEGRGESRDEPEESSGTS